VLSALRARVAGDLSEYLRSTTGDIAASEKPYLTPLRTYLMSARVKGGSSGTQSIYLGDRSNEFDPKAARSEVRGIPN
jgi:hypothetical protein